MEITKRFYTTYEVMQMLNISAGNYKTLKQTCIRMQLPFFKTGKHFLFPVRQFDKRLAVVEVEGMKNFNVKAAV